MPSTTRAPSGNSYTPGRRTQPATSTSRRTWGAEGEAVADTGAPPAGRTATGRGGGRGGNGGRLARPAGRGSDLGHERARGARLGDPGAQWERERELGTPLG